MRAAFVTLGCKVNQVETEAITGLFKMAGYDIVSQDSSADVVVINTCSVTHLGERKSRQIIRRAARANPNAMIVVTGCYAQIAPEQLTAIGQVDVIIGTQDRARIVELVEEARQQKRQITAVSDIHEAWQFEDLPVADQPGRTRAFLKVQEGCDNYCSYCIIPYTRGHLRSRSHERVVEEARHLVDAGYKEIVLTGIHLGAYGRETGSLSLSGLIGKILSETRIERLRLSSLESVEVDPALIRLLQTEKRLCPHLHLPLQAGDDWVLQRMNRHYNTAEYRSLLQGIRGQVPGIAVTTDVIVGFPGETDQMFENALNFISAMGFAKVHIFPYSRRSGTPAANFPDQVPETVKKQRVHLLEAVAEQTSSMFRKEFIGTFQDVLFEGIQDGMMEGLTGNYIRVYTNSQVKPGEIKCVEIEKSFLDGLLGRIK